MGPTGQDLCLNLESFDSVNGMQTQQYKLDDFQWA